MKESNTRLAVLNFERAEASIAKGQIGPALLWLSESWRSANVAENPGWQHTARAALSGWLRNFRPVRASFGLESKVLRFDSLSELDESNDLTRLPTSIEVSSNSAVIWVAFSPDGRKFLTLNEAGIAVPWDAQTSRPIGKPMPILNGDPTIINRTGRQLSVGDHDIAVTFTPDGRILLLGNSYSYGSAQLWDAGTGKPIGGPLDHAGKVANWELLSEISAIALSPDGVTAITAGEYSALLWNVASGEPIGKPMEHDNPIESVAFSPDGRIALTTCGNVAQLWDSATAKSIGRPLKHPSRSKGGFGPTMQAHSTMQALFSPDSRMVLTAFGQDARLWETATGQSVGSPMEHERSAIAMAFSPDSRTILTWNTRDGFSHLWDAATTKPIGSPMKHQSGVHVAAFSPDGRTVLTAGWRMEARLWDATTSKPIGVPMRHQGFISVAAFSPDGRLVLTAGEEGSVTVQGKRGTARLWDVTTGAPIGPPMEHPAGVSAAAFSPDGHTVLTGCLDGLGRLWDVEKKTYSGLPIDHHGEPRDFALRRWSVGKDRIEVRIAVSSRYFGSLPGAARVAFSPAGRSVVASHGTMARIWDLATGKPFGPPMQHQGEIVSVAFSPDGRAILTGGGFTARLWDAVTGNPLGPPMGAPRRVSTINGHSDYRDCKVSKVIFSPDGRTILIASDDQTAQLWDAAAGKPIGERIRHDDHNFFGATPSAIEVYFSPDSRTVLTKDHAGNARLWNATTCKPIGTQISPAHLVAFSPDGQFVLTAGSESARLWDAVTGKALGRPLNHAAKHAVWGGSSPVSWVAFSPDGRTVLTGFQDGQVRSWDIATRAPRGPIFVHPTTPGANVGHFPSSFSPNGHTVATAGGTTVQLWDFNTGSPLGQPMEQPSPESTDGTSHVSFSPAGLLVLTAGQSDVRLWDGATAKSVGPPIECDSPHATRFSPDGRSLLTDNGDEARLWDISLVPDQIDRVSLWLEVITGLTIATTGEIQSLHADEWRQRREQLDKLGGPPNWGPRWSIDPILAGSQPAARARELIKRERWADAKKAFDEAVRARPYNSDILLERGQFFFELGMISEGDDDFIEAFALGNRDEKLLDRLICNECLFLRACAKDPWTAPRLADVRARLLAIHGDWAGAASSLRVAVAYSPDNPTWRRRLILTLLAAGDYEAARRARAELLDRFSETTDPDEANEIARAIAVVPGAVDRAGLSLQLGERAAEKVTASQKEPYKSTLGAALYRAGRLEAAIDPLGRGIWPAASAFLGLAHQRLGHYDEARRWLNKTRYRKPDSDPNAVWDELEIRLIQTEAEAVILYDPVFPADPFAH